MPTTRPLRILLADDHETVRQGLRALFTAAGGVEVVHDVGDGTAAVSAARTVAPDVVVIDLSMTPIDGLTAMRQMREARRQIGIVVLTRYRESAYVREALAAGAAGYVLKQSPFSELLRAVHAVARGEQHLDPALREAGLGDYPSKPVDATSRATQRENEVLRRASLGHSNKEIGEALVIAVKTVEVHKANAMKKLGLRDRIALLRYASMHGWLRDL